MSRLASRNSGLPRSCRTTWTWACGAALCFRSGLHVVGRLLRLLDELEPSLAILERRGLSLPAFLAKAGTAGLPMFRVIIGNQDSKHTHAPPPQNAITRTPWDAYLKNEPIVQLNWR